jgi:hypothetical protein
LQADPHNRTYGDYFRNNRLALALTLLDVGEHPAAVDAADQMVRIGVDPVNDVYNAACILARCVPLAEHDNQLSEAERKQQAQTYADRAMATLRQAVQNGYKNVAHMKKAPDLDLLRRLGCSNASVSQKLRHARLAEAQAMALAEDVAVLVRWLREDIFSVAGPADADRCALYDFVVAELSTRRRHGPQCLAEARRLLQDHRHDLLAAPPRSRGR